MPIIIALLMLGALVAIVRRTSVPGRDERLMALMVGGYVLRLIIQSFSRNLSLFSHGGGGDYMIYEELAQEINRIWFFDGFGFITKDTLPALGPTSLPSNLYALIFALNGDVPTPLGCTAVVAAMACLTCLNMYHLGVELGADPRRSFILTAAFLFSPAYLLYTSDMYKDGPVLFFTFGAFASGVRLSRQISLVHAVIGALSLLALWHVRYYLVFVATAPLVVGLTGLRARSSARPAVATLVLVACFVLVAATTDAFDTVADQASATFAHGTNSNVIMGNSSGGSGVTFDDGGNPFGAMGPKLAYMIFSPFPWSGGSIGFHIGKIDTLLWYYILYRGAKAARSLWRRDRTLLLMLLIFMVPTTVVYATSFANVGLSLRQRLVIVVVGAVLAMRSWPVPAVKPATSALPTARRSDAAPALGPALARASRAAASLR